MPIVRIEMYEGRTLAQKAELARAITDAIVKIIKTTPEETNIIFYDLSKQNVAKGGVLVSDKD